MSALIWIAAFAYSLIAAVTFVAAQTYGQAAVDRGELTAQELPLRLVGAALKSIIWPVGLAVALGKVLGKLASSGERSAAP